MKKYLFILTVLLGVSLIFSACEKDKDSNQPAYVGTWESIETDEDGSFKSTMVLTASTLKSTFQMSEDGVNWFEGGGFEGTLSVVGDVATITIKKIGVVVDFDLEEMTPVVEWFSAADAEFADALDEYGFDSVTMTATIVVSGNTLTVTSPAENEEEEDEVMVFTKK